MPSQRLKRSMALAAALILSAVTLGVAPDASAQSTRVKTARTPTMTVQFKKLELFKKRGVMTVTYKIDKRTWANLQQARVAPTLTLYLPERSDANRFEFAYSAPLDKRKGALKLPKMDLRGVEQAEVRVVGFGGSYRITNMGIGKSKGRAGKYRLPVDYIGRPAAGTTTVVTTQVVPQKDMTTDIINTCKGATRYNSGFSKCIATANTLQPTQVIGLIKACDQGTSNDDGLVQCLATIKGISRDPVGVVAACDSATRYNSELLKCIDVSRPLAGAIRTGIISACGGAATNGEGAISCTKTARLLKQGREIEVVKACGKHTRYNSELNKCVELASKRRAKPDVLVATCGSVTSSVSALNGCIATATKNKTSAPVVSACGSSTSNFSQMSQCIVNASRR